jgi:hypothetical protein
MASISTTHRLLLLLTSLTTPASPFTLPHKSILSPTHLSSTAYGPEYIQPLNIEEDAPRDIATFQNWAYNYGIQTCESFTLTSTNPEYGEADVYASTSMDLQAGSSVVYVPEELILSSSKAMEELRGPEMMQAEKVLSSINADSELRQYYLMIKVCLCVNVLMSCAKCSIIYLTFICITFTTCRS